MPRRLDRSEVKEKLAVFGYELIDVYVNSGKNTRIKAKCDRGHGPKEFARSNLIDPKNPEQPKKQCPDCKTEDHLTELADKYNLSFRRVVERKPKLRAKWKCLECNYKFKAVSSTIMRRKWGCPECRKPVKSTEMKQKARIRKRGREAVLRMCENRMEKTGMSFGEVADEFTDIARKAKERVDAGACIEDAHE